jgi:hypothetical protein
VQGPCGSRFCCVICPSKKANERPQTDAADDVSRLRPRIEKDVTVEIWTMRDKKAQPVGLRIL